MKSSMQLFGLDLGAFKTALVTSNGRRVAVPSVIGWAKDAAGRAALGKDCVCGGEISKVTTPLDAVWPFRRGLQKTTELREVALSDEIADRHREAAGLLVQHTLKLMTPVPGQKCCAVVTMPGHVSLACKRALMAAVQPHFDAIMMVPEAFCVAYGLGRLDECLVIDVGAGKIDLCPMMGAYPRFEHQITIAQGTELIDYELVKLTSEKYPGIEIPLNAARQIKERVGCLAKLSDRALATVKAGQSSQEIDVSEPLRTACRRLVPGIVGAVREMLDKFDSATQRGLMENVLLTGGGSQLKGFKDLLQTALLPLGQVSVSTISDPVFAAAAGALKLASTMSADQWDALSVKDPKTTAIRRAA